MKWKKYPENKPKKYTSHCIVWTEDDEIVDCVFWSPIDSQHDHSIWKRTNYYLILKDLRELEKEAGAEE